MSLESDIIACEREIGLTGSLYDFVKLAWNQVYASSPYQDNWHIPLICEHYTAAVRGEIDKLVVNLPPNSSKSCITCVLFPVWCWIQDPHLSFIMSAYGTQPINRDSYASQDLIRSPWFQARWGDRFTIPNVTAVELVKNDRGGFRLGTTPGAGNATGWHANLQIFDDPNKPEECTTVGLTGTRDWYARTMSTRWRKPPEKNALICIMQRLHCDDLAQMFLDQGATHIMLPAEFDPTRRMRTAYGYDPRREKGELLDPVRLPTKLIGELRRNLGPINASAQLDQNPVPEGGAVFKKDWIKRYTPAEKPGHFDQIITSWDTAYKDEDGSDFVCGQAWGKVGVDFYLLDQVWDRLDFPSTLIQVTRMAKKWGGHVLIEAKANGDAVLSVLASKVSGLIAVDPQGGKFSRASAIAGLFEAGNVYLPANLAWVDEFITDELLRFPRCSHDDRVDAMTQALTYLHQNTNYLQAAMREVRKYLGRVDL